MALYPCAVGMHGYRSAQQTIYPAVVNGNATWRRKLRLCPPHFEQKLDYLGNSARRAQEDFDSSELTRCLVCGQGVVDSQFQFFATVYAKGAEREDFWAVLHDECVAAAKEDWLLTT